MTKITRVSGDEYYKHKALLLSLLISDGIDVIVLTHQQPVRHGESQPVDGICLTALNPNSNNNEIRTIEDNILGFSYIVNCMGYNRPEFGQALRVNLSADNISLECLACAPNDLESFGYDTSTFVAVDFDTLKPPSAPLDSEAVKELKQPGSRLADLSDTVQGIAFSSLHLGPEERATVFAVGPLDGKAIKTIFEIAATEGVTVAEIATLVKTMQADGSLVVDIAAAKAAADQSGDKPEDPAL